MIEVKATRKVGKDGNMAALNVWIPYSLSVELDKVRQLTGQNKGDAVTEALRYWINAQYEMGVKDGL